MDKVIIIDGVDVSGCAYITYRESNNPICSETGQYCNGYDICYFKQLKRLQAENEKLKQVANDSIIEQEKLIAKVNETEETAISLLNIQNELAKSCVIYKQALQEIRDMATLFHSVNEDKGLDRFKNNILAKINEVIGAEE